MPYIKLLTVLAGLALLTACAGGVTVNPTTNNINITSDGPCVANPFGTTCTNPTETQQVTFCRDEGKTTDTKTDDCAPTITRVCNANVFDGLCTTPTKEQAEVFCGDVTKTTNTKPADCAQTITDACTDDFFHSLCTAEVYVQQRNNFNSMCINQEGKTPQICEAEALARTCDADEFATGCVAQKYVDERRMTCLTNKNTNRCMPTEELICGTTGDIFDDFCTGLTDTDMTRQTACLANIDEDDSCRGDMGIATVFCKANLFDTSNACMHGDYDGDRETICQTHGTDETDGHATCATILIPFCTITNPFAHAGCDDVANINADIRTPYCQTPANAWNPKCMDTMHGAVTATRVTACQMFGTGMGGDDSCATSLISMCLLANPFIHEGCNDVVGIDAGLRTTYCAMPINAFKTVCKTDGTHGQVLNTQRDACLEFGIDTSRGGHGSCVGNTLAESSCASNPFDPLRPGCAILTDYKNIVGTYCTTINPSADECAVKTSAWVESFGDNPPPATLTATTPATERKRQFLTGLATVTNGEGLDDTGATDATHFSLTLKSAMYNGEPLGGAGDASDGFAAFLDTVATGNYLYYAGLLLNTDLGAPLTEPSGSVTWYGQIQIFRAGFEDNNEDFQLKITFGTNPAVDGSVGSIEGIVKTGNPNGNQHYQLKGTYDAGGVITGTTTRGAFTGSPLVTAEPVNGILTGLIGAQGAVGVFLSGSNIGAVNGSTKDNIIGNADSGVAYVGGFVAAPYVPAEDDNIDKVTFRDWLRGFDYPLPTSSAVEIARTTSKPHFIRPKTDGTLDLTGVTGTTQHKATRAGDDKDGFAYGVGKIVTSDTPAGISHNFVGILPSTDLGAPLTEAIAIAKWPGQFSFGNSATLNDIEFTLTFDGTDSGTINGMFGFVRFDLDFDGKGIITGDVTYSPSGTNPTTTVARGLIGEEGLVGVFTNINNGNTAGIEFGGFVADYVAPSVATYATFKTYYADSARTDERTLYATPTTTDSRGAFVEGTATGLPTDGFTFTSGNFAPVTVRLKKAVSGNDGFVLMYGNVSSGLDTRRFRAGLLPTTDLGPAVPTTSTATWAGSLHLGLAGGGVRNVDLPTVTVDFANGRITAPETEVGVGTGNTVTINGLFGAGLPSGTPAGILGGTVNFDFSGNPHTDRPLIGLIGTKGAIGVFHGNGLTLIGGFQASPN